MKIGGLLSVFNVFSSKYDYNQKSAETQSLAKEHFSGHLNANGNEFNAININYFLNLVEDDIIKQFLKFDSCYKLADNYLLSMVFVYFIRAKLSSSEYSRDNFFAALYLAHDIEEDDEDLKCHIMRWGLGTSHKGDVQYFLQLRDHLWKAMDCRACVSVQCCLQVMKSSPDCALWQRTRSPAHSGAFRSYEPEEECSHCTLPEFQYYNTEFESEETEESDSEEHWMPAVKRIKLAEE